VLVDHGETVAGESLGAVPAPVLHYPPGHDADHCQPGRPEPLPPRYRPQLANGPLTWQGTVLKTRVELGARQSERVLFDPEASASAAMRWSLADAVPSLEAESGPAGAPERWEARRDLLNSASADRALVVETEHDGTAQLRFGDDVHGRRPDPGTAFRATYRVGNGIAGNVGAAAIAHAVTDDTRVRSVTNPMPAVGGTEPETAAQVRRRAPQAFRTQERAVTPEDYAEVTERRDGVQRAAGSLRWTGSWHTVSITVDRDGGVPLDAAYTQALHEHVDRYRMAGHDLRFHDPVYVSLELDMLVCVAADYFRSNVHSGLLDVFSSGVRRDGRNGTFHPDNFSFGQTVHLSTLYAAAREVPGIDSLQITRFHRQGQEDSKPLDDGFMSLGRLEIPRLDNDPNFPEHGVLRLELFGGK